MRNLIKLTLLLLLTSQPLCTTLAGFYDQDNQYKGFYWFENKAVLNKNYLKTEYQMPTASEAATAIESRKKQLDDARAQMIAVGFDPDVPLAVKRQAVINYKKLEAGMWDGALSIVDASDMANFINPELADNQTQPANVFGIKLKRQIEAEQNIISIMEFAKDFDLLLFADESCRYCREFAPVLKRFIDQHQFELDVASLDSIYGGIAKSLGITGIPTLVAVKKDGSQMFEISRGVVSISQLEANILLAKIYSQELTVMNKGKKQPNWHKQTKTRG